MSRFRWVRPSVVATASLTWFVLGCAPIPTAHPVDASSPAQDASGPGGEPGEFLECQPQGCACKDPCADASKQKRDTAGHDASGDELAARYADAPIKKVATGKASYYADSLAGNLTASGERYDPKALTAAHRTLPFGSVVRVVRLDKAASVTVRITDRGPFAGRKQGRIIDLSRAAAERLDMIRQGVVPVRLELLN